jgi:hypothetical protein
MSSAENIMKALRPKTVQISPEVAFRPEDASQLPKKKLLVAKLQFTATCIRFDILFMAS